MTLKEQIEERAREHLQAQVPWKVGAVIIEAWTREGAQQWEEPEITVMGYSTPRSDNSRRSSVSLSFPSIEDMFDALDGEVKGRLNVQHY